jgi:hypothetical protein
MLESLMHVHTVPGTWFTTRGGPMADNSSSSPGTLQPRARCSLGLLLHPFAKLHTYIHTYIHTYKLRSSTSYPGGCIALRRNEEYSCHEPIEHSPPQNVTGLVVP